MGNIKVLTAFHHWVARRITGKTEKRGTGGEWVYLLVEEEMESVRLHPIGVYIKRQQKKIAERVAFLPVYTLCTEAERMSGTRRMVCWWDQDTVNEPEE